MYTFIQFKVLYYLRGRCYFLKYRIVEKFCKIMCIIFFLNFIIHCVLAIATHIKALKSVMLSASLFSVLPLVYFQFKYTEQRYSSYTSSSNFFIFLIFFHFFQICMFARIIFTFIIYLSYIFP